MTDLINRLENATGADRKLDIEITRTLGGCVIDGEWVTKSSWGNVPELTASLDACQALEQKLFPHSEHQITNMHSFSHVGVCLNMESPAYGTCKFGDEPYRTCRAWLAALLKAKD